MAERRMFAKTIVLSDAFLDMPISARCLYFTLGMLADDDGFVNAPRSIMRQCGASDDDMKTLISKKFVLLFDSGIIVIKHWRINNYLRNDRYIETKYIEEKGELSVDEKGSYHKEEPSTALHEATATGPLNNAEVIETWEKISGIPNSGIPSIGKDSIVKDSVVKGSTDKDNYIYMAKNFDELSQGLQAKAKHYLDLLDFSVNKCGHTSEETGIIGMAAKEGIEIERAGG